MTGTPGSGLTAPLSAADYARVGLDPATETILTAEETEAIGHAFAGWLGVGPRGVIVFPFTSLQPVPRPRRATADGRRRLPPGITTEGSRHPVWWLDAHTTSRDPDEGDLAFGVRLALEVEHRGVSVAGDGPVDVLAAGLGWILGDTVTDARVAAYANGGWDPDLCRFELRPHPAGDGVPAGRAELQRQARQFLGPRLALLEVLDARRKEGYMAALNAELDLLDRLEGALDGLIEHVRGCGEDLRRRSGNGDDRGHVLAARHGLAASVESLTAALEDLDDASRRHRAHGDRPVDAGMRQGEAAALIGAIYAAPGAEPRYRALHARLEGWRIVAAETAEATRGALHHLLRSSSVPDPAMAATGSTDPRHPLGDIGSVSPFPG